MNNFLLGLEISWEIIDEVTKVVIVKNDSEIYYLSQHRIKSENYPFQKSAMIVELSKVFDGEHYG